MPEMMTDSERIDWLEQHGASIQHHDYGLIGPWYVAPASGGNYLGKTIRETIDKAAESVARRERKRAEKQRKGA